MYFQLNVVLIIVYVSVVSDGLQGLIRKAASQANRIDRGPITGEVDEDEARNIRKRIELLEELKDLGRSQDVYAAYSADAAKQLVIEMKLGKSAKDRLAAANNILDRDEGKPVNRQVNMNMRPADFEDQELVARVKSLAAQLGISKDFDASRLIISSGEGDVRAVVQSDVRPEAEQGPQPSEEPQTITGDVAGEV